MPRPVKANFLDRAISWASPRWGARRALARAQLEAILAFYDGATVGRRGASIRRTAADVNVITSRTLPRLRGGSRDQVRNNGHARRAVEAIVSNTIGTGIVPQFLRDNVRAEDIEKLADEFLETTACDVEGRHTYYGLQAIAFQCMVESGEVLVRRRWRRLNDGLPVPVQFQVLEPDYLDESKNLTLPNGGRIIQGVEYDPIGRRRAYWLFRDHPGGDFGRGESRPVPATDIAHVFRTDRPGQVRGIPWIAPVLLRMADYADYVDAQVVRQKISACFAVFIEEAFDNPAAAAAMMQKAQDIIDRLEPGIIERLPPGTKATFAAPPGVENYGEFAQTTLREIAAGWGISYEALTGDLRGVNFSSGKMGRLEFDRNSDRWRMLTFVPQFCGPLTRWFLEAAELAGYDVEGVTVRHIAPRRTMIDPPREFRAERDAIRSGQKTLSEVILERGRDPVEHFTEYAEDMRRLDELGIVLDSDARPRTTAGNATNDEPREGDSDGSEDADGDAGAQEDVLSDRAKKIVAELEELVLTIRNGARR